MLQLTDLPIVSSQDDHLNFSPIADLIARRIKKSEPACHDCFGLYGPWGSGKTSLLNLVSVACGNKSVVWIEFDALRFQSQGDVLTSLLHEVARHIESQDIAFSFAARLTRAVAGTAISSLVELVPHGATIKEKLFEINDFIKVLDGLPALPDSPADEIRTVFSELIELLSDGFRKRVVISIDNLDRCRPDSVLNVIESAHLLLNVPGSTFIFVVDQQTLIEFVNTKYPGTEFRGAMYLEKLVPDYFRVPDPWVAERAATTIADMDDVQGLLHALLKDDACTPLRDYSNPIWRLIGNCRAMRNPRRIKRIIRRLSLLPTSYWKNLRKLRSENRGHANERFVAIFFLIALSDLWPHVYHFLMHADPGDWANYVVASAGADADQTFSPDQITWKDRDLRQLYPHLERGIELREFITSVSQWSCHAEVWSDKAFKRSLVWQLDELWDLVDYVRTIGL